MGEDARQDRQDAAGHVSTERVSVPQAADHLGTTVDAIRKRVQRGTIRYEKDADGRVWILLDTGRPRQDADQDTTGHGRDSAVVVELRDRIRYLERQVEEEREARRRADTILAQLSRANEEQARTIRAIEAPSDASREEASESPESPAPSEAPTDAGGEAHEPTEHQEEERRGWFRRFFGL